MSNLPTEQISKLLDIAILAARAGGVVLDSYWGKQLNIREKGRAGDLITEVDQKAEAEILKVIKRHYPDHAILAEESGIMGTSDNQYLWVIDPLDGTTNYAHSYPQAAVSVGLIVSGIPTVGVVYNPMLKELWSAAQGLGATLNNIPIQVSTTDKLGNSLLVTGFAYDRRETEDNNYSEFCYLTHLTQGVRRGGSASLDLCHVATGRLDGYWERGLKPWDLLGGIVILKEAGGKISAYDGSEFDLYSGRILATNGYLHSALSQALLNTPHGADLSFK
ncbi:MAG: inositol monophosphatase [Cyanobacteria bacterium]|nr:inositol monophosphatase [Cyanobacteria bacterium CG_2015-16_32_12]NCO79080.1 inositol monophosphatase [Cyanobacteria bacterium CG_2015-22_32_23]NCQ04712.1 inositol monophosphatase [Cyanobacteria bacterium CG_2015-09_32_10]NCQ42601.1 inositol monophosphatase [Cyanobacteria bacterium CG_2015-04_32_10]NCS85822.1 inositol monophosphatase [Cyanobacteria bacterium CG_2015-02_32_10]